MKTPKLLAVGVIALAPFALFADATTDRNLEATVKSTYNFRRVLEKERVDVKVHNGVVTLNGTVVDEDHRRLAEDTAASIQGVARVENNLRIESRHREGSDDWIAAKVRSKLLFKANVKLKDIDVAVRDGVVMLTGVADSAAQKDLTEAYVREIAGVREVRNELRVMDKATRNEVERREHDVNVNAGAEARVERERDELRVERARAEAKIDQERAELRRERAEVRRDIEEERERARDRSDRIADRDLGDKIDDGSITAHIKSELFVNRSTSGLKTKIDTHNGHVLITGEAATEAEKELVTKIARNVRGVASVNNRMTVRR